MRFNDEYLNIFHYFTTALDEADEGQHEPNPSPIGTSQKIDTTNPTMLKYDD